MSNPSPTSQNAAPTNHPLLSRSTVVILISYQFGMMLGNGIPTTLKSLTLLIASTLLISYLGCVLFRSEKQQKQRANKHKKTAVQVSRRIRRHISDQPAREQPAPLKPRMRSNMEFASVVSSWE